MTIHLREILLPGKEVLSMIPALVSDILAEGEIEKRETPAPLF
jgi:hypothetical protein